MPAFIYSLFWLQLDAGAGSFAMIAAVVGIISAVAGALATLGLPKLIDYAFTRKKTTAEANEAQANADAVRRRVALDEQAANASEYDKTADRIIKVAETIAQMSERLREKDETIGRTTADLFMSLRKTELIGMEKDHLEKSLETVRKEKAHTDKMIVELREKLALIMEKQNG